MVVSPFVHLYGYPNLSVILFSFFVSLSFVRA